MIRRLVPMVLALIVSACATTYPPDDIGEASPRDVYPVGPYGYKVGEIIENLTFSNPDDSPFTLDDHVFKIEHNRVLFMATSAGWCTVCDKEQKHLQALYTKYSGRGLAMLEVYFEDRNERPATGAQAAKWKDNYELSFPVLTQTPFRMPDYLDRQYTPLSMVIGVDTMEILYIGSGFKSDEITPIIEANLN